MLVFGVFCNDKIISSMSGEGGLLACKTKVFSIYYGSYKDIGKNYDEI